MSDFISGMLENYKIVFLIFCLFLFFVKLPSVGFFVGLILKLFRIKYTDKDYKEYEMKQYNQQLFRLKTGVRAASTDDAKLISDALNNGRIDRSTVRFTSLFGPVGVKRTIRLQSITAMLFGVLFIGTAFSTLYSAPYIKSGYVTYHINNVEKLYISQHRVYDKKHNVSYNKSDCTNLIKDTKSIQQLKDACLYITTNDSDIREELREAINSESTGQILLVVFVFTLLFIGWFLIIGFNNFVKFNKLVCDMKDIK